MSDSSSVIATPAVDVPAEAITPPSAPGSGTPLTWVAFDPKWIRRTIALALVLFVLLDVVLWFYGRTSNFLLLLVIAWLFGTALEPIVGWLARRGMKRGLATGIAMISFVLLAIIFMATFGGLLVQQLAQLLEEVPKLIDQAADWASKT